MQDMPSMNRRTFVKSTGALGALAAVGGAAATGANLFGATEPALAESEEKITWGHCAINCPGRCSLKFHVKDDEVVWVDTCTSKDAGFDDPQPRACLRGRTYRRWMNHPDRINYPMKRVGKRGEGKFERISWDEAIDLAATKLKEVIEKYGNEAAEETSILYGGSCKASNAPELFAKPNIDGGLIGGASLKAADFKGIIDAWKK